MSSKAPLFVFLLLARLAISSETGTSEVKKKEVERDMSIDIQIVCMSYLRFLKQTCCGDDGLNQNMLGPSEVLPVSCLADAIPNNELIKRRLQVTAVNGQEGTVFCKGKKKPSVCGRSSGTRCGDQPLASLFEESHLRLFLPLHLADIHQSDTRGC
jgi:hypothetical protein